jgi:hypothetical protein
MRTVPPLRHQTLKPHPAGGAKQIRPDLALLERRDLRAAGIRKGLSSEEARNFVYDTLAARYYKFFELVLPKQLTLD